MKNTVRIILNINVDTYEIAIKTASETEKTNMIVVRKKAILNVVNTELRRVF